MTTRKQVLTVSAGALLCLLAAPVGVFAGTPSTQLVAPNTGATRILTSTATPTRSSAIALSTCNFASVPNYIPDPVLGTAGDKFLGDSYIATTPTLPANTLGITSTASGVTGSLASPVPAGAFAAGFSDETELYEYLNNSTTGANPAGSPGAYDSITPPLNTLPSGTVTHTDGTTSTGAGLPYAAIYAPGNLSTPLIASIPTTILGQTYTPNTAAWMPNRNQPTSTCSSAGSSGGLYSLIDFDVSQYIGSGKPLQANTTYVAYLLTRDTDVSGPVANHLWYFQATPNTPPAATFTLSKSVSPSTSPVSIGTPLAYTITLTNTSANAGDPGVVADTITTSGGLTYHLSAGPTASQGTSTGPTSGVIDWTPGSVAAGAAVTLRYTLVPDATGGITNTAVNGNTNCPTPGVGACTTTTNVSGFTLSKSVSPSTSPVPVGTPLAYTITLTNSSTTAGDPGVVADTITTSGGLTYHLTAGPTASQGTSTGPTSGVIDWTPGSVAAGAAVTLRYTLVPDATGGITNTAVNGNTNCPTPGVGACTTTTTVAAYRLAKSVTPPGSVAVGTPLSYTVTVTNLSSTVAGDPGTIIDTPTTVGGATFSVTSGPAVSQGSSTTSTVGGLPQFTWAPGTLAAGGQATLTVVLTPTGSGTGASPAVDNTAYDTNTNCPTPGGAACTTSTPLNNFSLSKTVAPTGTVTIGSTLTYTVTVTNLTTQAGDPGTVSDAISTNGVTYSVTSGPTVTQGTVSGTAPSFSWLPGSLGGNASATATIVLQVTGVTVGTTNPSIANTAFDILTNCSAAGNPACTPTTPVADFQMSKSVSPTGAVTVGSALTYTVRVTNTTANAGDPGTVADAITANGVTYAVTGGPSASQGTVSGTAPAYSWVVGSLGGNRSATLTLVIQVTGVTAGATNPSVVNTAVDTNTNCPTAGTAACTTDSPLIVLTLTKTVNHTTAAVGDTLTYTITVGNTGAATAGNVLVDDVFGGDAGFLVNDGTNGTSNSFAGSPAVTVTRLANGHYQWTYATIRPGDTDTVTFTAVIQLPSTVPPAANGSITLTNTVSIPTYSTGTGTYVNPGTNPPPVTVSTTAPYAGGVLACTTATCPSPGGVQGITTTPNTGANLNITLAGFLFLGGLGLILVGVLARRPEDTIS